MASPRRGGRRGLQAPELRGTLGTLIKTTLAQAGVVRDVLERGAREGRSRLDEALANRRRADALATLGEIVLDLIRRGEIDVDQLPEVRDVLARLDELDRGAAGVRSTPDAPWKSPTRDEGLRRWIDLGADFPSRTDAEPADERPFAPKRGTGGLGHGFARGGDDDDDLVDYMHPGDVPAKESR